MPERTPPVLDRLWDDIPVGHLPIEGLLGAGHARRRRHRAVVAGAALATVLIAGAGVVGAQTLSESGARPDSTIADTGPTVPSSGTRLVGIGRVAVAVPASWDENAASCNAPVRDTTFFPTPQDCVGPHRLVSSVAVTAVPPDARMPADAALDPDGEVQGHQVVATEASCSPGQGESCHQMFGVPDLHAYFSVTIPQDDPSGALNEVRAIRDSLTVLSDDEVAVPVLFQPSLNELRTVLEEAGLDVQVDRVPCPPNAYCGFGVTSTDPAPGAVVPLGSPVTVVVTTSGDEQQHRPITP